MVPSFNLIDQPWIPCLQRDGRMIELSLRDLFTKAHELVDIAADSPMENAAIYRFLLAILHRNFGPTNSKQWQKLWQVDAFPLDVINSYLAQWHGRFDLFSAQYPFGQFSEDKRVKPKSVVSLKHGFGMLPSGWFDHQVTVEDQLEVRLSPAEAARDLLTVLAFGFGGLSGIPRVSHTDAFCAKGVIFVVQGDTLKQTLMLNLAPYKPDRFAEFPDLPFWEAGNPLEFERTQPAGLLDHYTFPSRSVTLYLDPDQVEQGKLEVYQYRLGLGLSTSDVLDPMKHYYESAISGLQPLTFDEDRQLWHNSASLFELNPTGKKPPAIFAWLNTLVSAGALERSRLFQCKAVGIAKNRGRADFARQERFPLPLSLLADEQRLARLKEAVDSVERTARIINRALAITSMYIHLDDPTKFNWKKRGIKNSGAEKDLNQLKATEAQVLDWIKYTGVERHFWAALDAPFMRFIERLGQAEGEELTAVKIWWQAQIRQSAHDAFRHVLQYTNETPRAFKAFAHGNNRLQGYLNRNLPKEKTA